MSVFNDENNEQAPNNPLETLVGEGRKYATVEELAKAYDHADKTIADRNRELALMREELNARLDAEELFKRLEPREPNHEPRESPLKDLQPPVEEPKIDKDVDLAERIREELARAEKERIARTNLDVVQNRLIEAYGDQAKANEVIRAKAAELGIPLKLLEDVAAQSPKAFFAQLGLENTSNQSTPAPRSDVNPRAIDGPSGRVKEGTWRYFEEIRKTDPRLYFSPRIQNQLHKKAHELGDAFYE